MPRKLNLDSRGYWEAYSQVKPRGYVPLLSIVGLARAMRVPATNKALRAYEYLASHSMAGYWLQEQGEATQYEALLRFIESSQRLMETMAPIGGAESWLEPPFKGMESASDLEKMAGYVSVASATYGQIGEMFPEYTEGSRLKAASDGIAALIDARAIVRVYEGVKGRASLYAFLPVVYKTTAPSTCHWWGDDFQLDDFDEDAEEASGRPRPAWPWP